MKQEVFSYSSIYCVSVCCDTQVNEACSSSGMTDVSNDVFGLVTGLFWLGGGGCVESDTH